MRRLNNLVTLFSAMFAFFFGWFLATMLTNFERCLTKPTSNLDGHKNEIFLLILILSAPSYFERRQTIRDTWLRLGKPLRQPYYPEDFIYMPEYDDNGFLQLESVAEQDNRLGLFLDWMKNVNENGIGNRRDIRTKHIFVIGTQDLNSALNSELKKEQKSYNDLLLLNDLKDSYSNLTMKLLMSIETIVNNYNFNYILKTDDDTYVKLDFLLNDLVSYDRKLIRKSKEYGINNPLPELYWGYFNGRAQIKTRGQWKEPNFYLCNRYLSYALGGGYIFSRTIAEFIESNSKLLSTYVNEDVSFGVWIASLRNIYRKHDVRFDTGYMPRKCRSFHIVLHKRTIDQMKDLFEDRLCTFENVNEELMKRPSEYYYDWKKSADKCCDSLVVA